MNRFERAYPSHRQARRIRQGSGSGSCPGCFHNLRHFGKCPPRTRQRLQNKKKWGSGKGVGRGGEGGGELVMSKFVLIRFLVQVSRTSLAHANHCFPWHWPTVGSTFVPFPVDTWRSHGRDFRIIAIIVMQDFSVRVFVLAFSLCVCPCFVGVCFNDYSTSMLVLARWLSPWWLTKHSFDERLAESYKHHYQLDGSPFSQLSPCHPGSQSQ